MEHFSHWRWSRTLTNLTHGVANDGALLPLEMVQDPTEKAEGV